MTGAAVALVQNGAKTVFNQQRRPVKSLAGRKTVEFGSVQAIDGRADGGLRRRRVIASQSRRVQSQRATNDGRNSETDAVDSLVFNSHRQGRS